MSNSTLDCIDIFGSLPREEVINRFTYAAVEEHCGTFALNNFEVECTEYHEELAVLGMIHLVVLPESEEDESVTTLTLHRDRTTALKWQCDESIPVTLSTLGLTFIVQVKELGDIGCFSILLQDINAYRDATTAVNERIFRTSEHDSESNFPTMKLAVDVATTPMDVQAAQKYRNTMLALAFGAVFERTGKIEDIDVAIKAQTNLVDLTPIDDEGLPGNLDTLSQFYRSRFERTRDITDAKNSLAVQRRAVHFAPEGQACLAQVTAGLGVAYMTYFEATKRPSYLDTGIAALRKAMVSEPSDVIAPMNLCIALEKRFESFLQVHDLKEALQICRETLRQVRTSNQQELPRSLERLAGLLYCQHKYMGRSEDMEEGVSLMREAIGLLDENDSGLPSVLCNLGVFLIDHYTLGGELVDLEEGITVTQRAILLAGEGSGDLAKAHNILGILLLLRFDHTKHLSDIEEAVACGNRAVDSTVNGDPSLPVHLSNFGVELTSYFSATNDLAHLERAISVQERAAEMTEDGSTSMSYRLGSLAETLHTLFKYTRKLSDLDRAIACVRKGIDCRLPSMADRAGYLHNLAMFCGERFHISREIVDIENCLSMHREVIEQTPPASALLPNRLLNLGHSLVASHTYTNNTDHLLEAMSYFEQAAKSRFGPPNKRIENAREWIHIASLINHPSLISAYDTAIGLLSVVGGLEQTIERRHESLANISNLALEAAAAAFELERIDKAVEWLEEGRCLVWNQLMDLRGSVVDLRSSDEELAERIFSVSQALDKAGSRKSAVKQGLQASLQRKVTSQDETLQHLKLANEWEELLQTVHNIPGFENFLQPASLTDLTSHLPEDGPVVIINVHKTRCDAIALLSGCDDPVHIPLTDFSLAMAEEMRREIQDGLSSIGIRARSIATDTEVTDTDTADLVDRAMKPLPRVRGSKNTFKKILAQLWTCVVEPILDNLGFSPSDNPGRIWWCPTGPLSFLPLHAAGIYASDIKNSVCLSDYAASSYTPTISSLVESWKRSKRDQLGSTGIALISQTDTPGLPSLPGTASEIAMIQAQAQEYGVQTLVLGGENATTEATMDTSNPLHSGFHLHDDLLKLSTIIKDNPGDATLSEEAVHLAAGMLAAGYSSVVATMWAIPDLYAPTVAKHFYTDVFSRGNGSLDGSQTAYALHHAVQTLRKQLGNSPYSYLAWVPYVHFGL
ncbi:hypothetical protein H1R20_g12343, partial [Candolleomyces eurysporus]